MASHGYKSSTRTADFFTIAAGKWIKAISVPIWPGASPAADETFTITLTGVRDPAVTLIRDTGTGTILGGA